MRVSPENFLKVGIMALLFLSLVRFAAAKLGIPGLAAVAR